MEGLGIDLRLLTVQIINFLILFLLLRKWVYPPFIKFLDKRAEKIEESLRASEKMRKELKIFEGEKAVELKKIRERSQIILDEARREAQVEKENIITNAHDTAAKVINEAQTQIGKEKEKALREAREEIVALSLAVTKKVLGNIDETTAHNLIAEALEKVDDAEIKKFTGNF